jgi:acetylornithine deacetylase/succinyl-diaminopimelate desuccinylase-like protein
MRQVHGIDEHVAIDDYLMAVRYYYSVMGQAAEP